jgi:hypothetical protein
MSPAADSLPLPLLSVVMPSLNQGRFLAEAVRSVLDQPVEGIELVVVDGGSADDTVEQLAALAAQYPGRLRWNSGPDDGPAQAINRAVALARGSVIGWLNSDDLYEPGAIQRALDHLAGKPADVMVYGEATHVDVDGHLIGPYPTQGPQTTLAEFSNGCFICQPTVFVQRDAWAAVGGLDESLRTAFDFDLWLKLFKAYPGRIGHLPQLQARSRLHEGGITMRMRERVALEGMQLIHRHLGVAPPGWLLTHFGELCAAHPFQPEPVKLVDAMHRLVDQAAAWLAPDAMHMLRQRIATDRPLQLATPHVYVDVHPDGWAGRVLEVRLRQPDLPYSAVVLRCRHASPVGGALRIEVTTPGLTTQHIELMGPGWFNIVLPVAKADQLAGARVTYRVVCQDTFVPAQVDAGSADWRQLAFLVEGCEPVA